MRASKRQKRVVAQVASFGRLGFVDPYLSCSRATIVTIEKAFFFEKAQQSTLVKINTTVSKSI
jgi:hypothetical protein